MDAAEERLLRLLSHTTAVGTTSRQSSSSSPSPARPVVPPSPTATWSQLQRDANCLMDACGASTQPRSGDLSQEPPATAVNPSSYNSSNSINNLGVSGLNPSTSSNTSCSSMEEAMHSNVEEQFVDQFSKHLQQQHTPTVLMNRGASVNWPNDRECIFCKIIHGYEHAFKLYEDDFCVCILDINPLCYGHSLLVPKGHFPSLDVTPPQVAAAMCSVVPLISNVIMEATSCDAFNLVVNSGEAAGQVVFHTHFHIVPRFSGDGLWTNESVNRKKLSTFKDPAQLMHAVRTKLASRC